MNVQPPVVAVSPALRYVLRRALARVATPVLPAGAREVQAWALRLDLAGRIAARVPLEQLRAELGRPAALELFARGAALREQARRRADHARRLLDVAAWAGIPVALLKSAALEHLGLVAPGARRAGDVDLLVPMHQAAALQRLLLERGWRERGLRAHGHELAPLVASDGEVAECHLRVPGVRVGDAQRDADFARLVDAGLLVEHVEGARAAPRPSAGGTAATARGGDDTAPAASVPRAVYVPTPVLLRAHLVAHTLWQHGLTPHAYPAGRLLADGLDLGLDDGRVDAVAPLVHPRVTAGDLVVLVRLLLRLAVGDDALLADGERSDERRLLDHVVAGVSDEGYARALRRAHLRRGLGNPLAWPAALGAALWPTALQLDLLYGPAHGWRARAWRRLKRPAHVVRRVAGALPLSPGRGRGSG